MKKKIAVASVMLVLASMTSSLVFAAAPSALSKRGNNEPIEINADTLEVFQEENRAVFTGHVVAIQGDVRLKSEKMNVFYRNTENKEDTQNAIKKIDVSGSVFLSTPDETASGDFGTYDVEHNKIHLNDNVVLTREKNVLKGDKLTYDLTAGKSVISGGAKVTNGGKKDRVRALFLPDNSKDKK
ncbi:MAG: lipopolysaccharide transport periplasmic protein LptA [Rickettsiales bacterium]